MTEKIEQLGLGRGCPGSGELQQQAQTISSSFTAVCAVSCCPVQLVRIPSHSTHSEQDIAVGNIDLPVQPVQIKTAHSSNQLQEEREREVWYEGGAEREEIY
ncbi:unnamed protein product [Caretta caretta]